MLCPNCDVENDESNAFCIHCGAALRAEHPEEASPGQVPLSEVSSGGLSLAVLQRQVHALQQEVRGIRSILSSQGVSVPAQEPRQVRRPVQTPAPRQPVPVPASSQPAWEKASAPLEPGPPLWERLPVEWELVLGGNWLARIGVLAVVIGTGFFLKLAFDNNWIGKTGRVVLGIVGGLAMLGASEYWRKQYRVYAQALAGGGVALLYLSIFAAFALFGLIDLYPAIGLLLLISVASAALAVSCSGRTCPATPGSWSTPSRLWG